MNHCTVSNHGVDLHSMSDAGLIAAAQSGQEWAFVELCTRSSKRAFGTIYSVTRNREDAEDALQDSMLRAFQHLQGRSSFATWFTRIGINSALMILRKRRVRPETPMDLTAEGESWRHWQISEHATDPEKHYAGCERSRHLKRAICELPTSLRAVIEQGQMKGYSTKQIAAAPLRSAEALFSFSAIRTSNERTGDAVVNDEYSALVAVAYFFAGIVELGSSP